MSTARALRSGDLLYPAAAFAVGIALWWLLSIALAIPSFLLPSPDEVAAQLAGNPRMYAVNALATVEKVVFGGAVGILFGFGFGLLVGTVPFARRALYPYLVTVRVLPKIAIAPLLLIYLGTGFTTAVVFVALVTFFPLVVSTAAGLARTPEGHLDLLRSVNAGPVDTLLMVRLPYALPDVFAGLKQSVTLAVVGAVVAEWVVARRGLGYLILLGMENLRTDIMIAALSVLVVVGLTFYGCVVLCQRAVDRRFPVTGTDS